jgi:cytidyltransferase-like protein
VNISDKIKSFEELCYITSAQKAKGKMIVQCHGVFDIIHPGIIKHIESARKQGDVLVVTVIKDKDVRKGPNYPIFGERLRAENVASIEYVDYVSIVDNEIDFKCVELLKPDVFARGQDYKNRLPGMMEKIEDEEKALKQAGCKIHYTCGETFISMDIINRFINIYSEKTQKYLKSFKRKYKVSDIIKFLESLNDIKTLVIGDMIIDEYNYCEPMGKSSKDPIIVHRYLSDELFAGGAAAVANHISGVCDNVDLVTILGRENSKKDFILSKLRPNIKPTFFFRHGDSTILKRRFIDHYLQQKLFEICYMDVNEIPQKLEKEMLDYLTDRIPEYDLVMVCDFGHNLVTGKLISLVEKKAKILAVNVQTNGANLGFNLITKYHKVDFACLDEPEARLACQDKYGRIEKLAWKIAKNINSDNLIITRGKHGSIGVDSDGNVNVTPAFSSMVVDRIGAGDAFFAFTALCFAKELSLDLISFIGNVVGAIAVQIVCNREPVDQKKLYQFICTLLH